MYHRVAALATKNKDEKEMVYVCNGMEESKNALMTRRGVSRRISASRVVV